MIKIQIVSENALFCSVAAPASLEKQRKWWSFADKLEQEPDITEVVVGMNNLTIFANTLVDLAQLQQKLQQIWQLTKASAYQGKHIDIPVYYGGEWGEDLAEVAEYHGISIDEVVKRHTEPTYTVFMMGFQPGFPYLGGLPEHLHTPRRAVPRTKVPAGAVGIGGSQTGVYPFSSPGGWQIIGRTQVPLFQAQNTSPTLLQAGDTVRFVVERVEQ